MRVILCLFSLLFLVSCASYLKRKECEKTNWYDYGQSFALTGKRLDASDFVKQCREVEAKIDDSALDVGFKAGMKAYCTVNHAYKLGLEGGDINYNFCDSSQHPKLRQRFDAGRDKLCSSGGYDFGASGNLYGGQCQSKGEDSFLKDFKRGRKKYLENEITIANEKIRNHQGKIRQMQFEVISLQSQQRSLSNNKILIRDRIYDESTKQYREENRWEEDPQSKDQRIHLQSQEREVQSKIRQLEEESKEAQKKIDENRRELVKLEG